MVGPHAYYIVHYTNNYNNCQIHNEEEENMYVSICQVTTRGL